MGSCRYNKIQETQKMDSISGYPAFRAFDLLSPCTWTRKNQTCKKASQPSYKQMDCNRHNNNHLTQHVREADRLPLALPEKHRLLRLLQVDGRDGNEQRSPAYTGYIRACTCRLLPPAGMGIS